MEIKWKFKYFPVMRCICKAEYKLEHLLTSLLLFTSSASLRPPEDVGIC